MDSKGDLSGSPFLFAIQFSKMAGGAERPRCLPQHRSGRDPTDLELPGHTLRNDSLNLADRLLVQNGNVHERDKFQRALIEFKITAPIDLDAHRSMA